MIFIGSHPPLTALKLAGSTGPAYLNNVFNVTGSRTHDRPVADRAPMIEISASPVAPPQQEKSGQRFQLVAGKEAMELGSQVPMIMPRHRTSAAHDMPSLANLQLSQVCCLAPRCSSTI